MFMLSYTYTHMRKCAIMQLRQDNFINYLKVIVFSDH